MNLLSRNLKLENPERAHPDAPFSFAAAGAPTPFHAREYLMAYRRAFGARKTFHRLRAQGQAGQNAAAWFQSRGRTAKRLEFWGAGIHDIGGATFDSPGATSTLWRKIESLASRHDGAHLAQIPADSPLIALAQSSGWSVSEAQKCPVLILPNTWEEYLPLLGKNMREQIKRYPKRLEKEFRVEYSLAQSEAETQIALDDLFRLHGQRWRARGQTGVLATSRRQQFHRAVCASFLKKGWLRLWTLRCDEKPVCVLLNYFHGGKYYYFIGGFDPEYARWSVGVCLFAKVIRAAMEEGAREFDFLKGEEEYKYRYGAINRDYKTISFFASSPRGDYLKRRVRLEEKMMRKLHEKFSSALRK